MKRFEPNGGAATNGKWKTPTVMATVGPTLEKPQDLEQAIKAGAHWFRLPVGYRQRPHLDNARAIRSASAQTGIPVQLLLDLPSSRPRTGAMDELQLTPGDRVVFWDPESSAQAPEHSQRPLVPLPGLTELLRQLKPQHRMWFCDGRLCFVVEAT